MPTAGLVLERRLRSGRYDLLMAIDHLLEGAQLYGKAAQDAAGAGDSEAAEFFGSLERGSRRQAQVARELLERPMPQRAQVHAAVGS